MGSLCRPLVLAAALLFPIAAGRAAPEASGKATVSGRIIDGNGQDAKGVARASVRLISNETGATLAAVFTGADGSFRADVTTADTAIRCEVEAIGFGKRRLLLARVPSGFDAGKKVVLPRLFWIDAAAVNVTAGSPQEVVVSARVHAETTVAFTAARLTGPSAPIARCAAPAAPLSFRFDDTFETSLGPASGKATGAVSIGGGDKMRGFLDHDPCRAGDLTLEAIDPFVVDEKKGSVQAVTFRFPAQLKIRNQGSGALRTLTFTVPPAPPGPGAAEVGLSIALEADGGRVFSSPAVRINFSFDTAVAAK